MITVITDTHLKQGNEEQICDIFIQVVNYCLNNNIKTLIHCGDFFTSRTSQSLSVLLVANDILNNISNSNIELFIIPGNHDKTNLENERSYLDVFSKHRNVHILDKEATIFSNYHFLPYFKENGSYLERLNKIKVDKNKKNILFTHIAISGVRNNDGSLVENNLKTELFDQFDLVISGHYHNRQQISDKVWYIGSTHPQSYGEDNDKGLCIIKEDLSLEFVKLEFSEYYQFKFNCSDLNKIKKQLKEINQQNNNRFIITGNEPELDNFDRKIFDGYKVEVKYNKVYENKKIELKKYKTNDILDSFELFCKDKKTDINIKSKCLDYLNKVL